MQEDKNLTLESPFKAYEVHMCRLNVYRSSKKYHK